MVVVDDISETSVSQPDLEQMIDEQFLSPGTSLRDLQQQWQVGSDFNA